MVLKTKVPFREFVRLVFGLVYQRFILKLLVAVALAIVLWIVFYYMGMFHLPKPIIYQYLTLALIVVAQPIVIYTTTHSIYYSSNHLRETVETEITKRRITIDGESFYMELNWDKIFRVVETKNWFLIYQNKLSAVIIPKKRFHKTDILELRQILKSIENVPVKLLTS